MAQLRSHAVTGTAHRADLEKLKELFPGVEFCSLDVCDGPSVRNLIRRTKPDICFHLAGIASLDEFARQPNESMRVNVEGWIHVLEAFKQEANTAKILFISSAQVYGDVPEKRLPVTEEERMEPGNFYSVSKSTCEQLARIYRDNESMNITVLRPFNHIGPGQSTSFVCSSLAKQIARIAAGQSAPVVQAGNMTTRRDFTDVRDVARAYVLAAGAGVDFGPYNICSGEAIGVAEIFERLQVLAGVRAEVKSENALIRKADQKVMLGSAEKFCRATGWKPEISLDTTLRDTLDYWKIKE